MNEGRLARMREARAVSPMVWARMAGSVYRIGKAVAEIAIEVPHVRMYSLDATGSRCGRLTLGYDGAWWDDDGRHWVVFHPHDFRRLVSIEELQARLDKGFRELMTGIGWESRDSLGGGQHEL